MHGLVFETFHAIGRGGQADVFLARHRGTEFYYAAKVLREAWDPYAREAFRREVARQLRVAGSKIVRVVAHNLDAAQPFVILEWMPRGSLADRIEEAGGRPWVPGAALQAVLQVAEAVADLHAKNVLHLDIKPGNVLYNRAGRLILNDLGLAATTPAGGYVTAASFFGTPGYAAPEQFHAFANQKTDVYPLGVILNELLTGTILPRNWATAIWPSRFHPLSPELDRLVQTLAAQDWRYRPSAREAVQLIMREVNRLLVRDAIQARARASWPTSNTFDIYRR
jgi:serine/threonine-protein kinase